VHVVLIVVVAQTLTCVWLLNFSACLEARPQTPTIPLSNQLLSSRARRRPVGTQMSHHALSAAARPKP
jgi:hypothetical protein